MTAYEGELRFLVVSDLHHGAAAASEGETGRDSVDLLARVLRRARREGDVDAVVLLGDLVEDGGVPGAERDMAAMRELLYRSGLPFVVVPGNHDGRAARVLEVFGDKTGPHTINGYVLYSFADRYEADDRCRRSERELDALQKYVMAHPEQPIIVLQHNPVHPPIESDYPYNLTNAEQVRACYSGCAVVLSVSGHYHAGQPLTFQGGVGYVTCPSLCEPPFTYLRVHVHGGEVEAVPQQLALDGRCPLSDVHVHTQFAYCSGDLTARAAVEEAARFNVGKIALVEHSDQLYLDWETFQSQRLLTDPDLPRRMREEHRDRYDLFRGLVEPLRSERVLIGLEVECDARFDPILLPEDRDGWDLLLGAVHWITEPMVESAGGLEEAFMRLVDALVNSGIDVLAHPFRFFRAQGLPVPRSLFGPVAHLLAEEGVAAEVNFHNNQPDPDFFRLCLEEGVKIALGTDSHHQRDVGDLQPHLDFLRTLGVTDDLLPEILFRP